MPVRGTLELVSEREAPKPKFVQHVELFSGSIGFLKAPQFALNLRVADSGSGWRGWRGCRRRGAQPRAHLVPEVPQGGKATEHCRDGEKGSHRHNSIPTATASSSDDSPTPRGPALG